MNRFLLPVSVLMLVALASSSVADNHLSYWYRNYNNEASRDLLTLVLEKTEDFYGPITVSKSPQITQGRAVAELGDGHKSLVSLINVVVDEEREKSMIPVKIPTDGGLIGLRVCIIRKDERDRFHDIRSHLDIREKGITFGQGLHWPDTQILQENDFPVVTSVRYEGLFDMLREKRFNCFLRGANEAMEDLKNYGNDELMIEPDLLFAYPSASFFFVSQGDSELAARLELGLRRAILDGSYEAYFRHHYQPAIDELKLDQRRIIRLNNPLLSDQTLLNAAEKLRLGDGKLPIY